MIFIPDTSIEPVFVAPPCKPGQEHPQIPKCATPLIEPLTEREQGDLYPKPYRILQNIRSISACCHRNAAIDINDNLWTWGAAHLAQASDGTFTMGAPQPVEYIPVKRMENVEMVSVGAWHTMCITKDHKLWGWGDNEYGQLGLGNCRCILEPTLIMDGVIFVMANETQTFVIKEDKSLWGWGYNAGTEFCKSNGTLLNAPKCCHTPIHLLDSVIGVSSNDILALAVKEDKTLWGWGNNKCNSIFTQSRYGNYEPTPMMANVKSISLPLDGGIPYCFAIDENNDLYSFGDADEPGSVVPNKIRKLAGSKPVKVMEHVAEAYAGNHFSLVRLLDNRLFAVGDNGLGQCGNGKSTGWIRKPTFIMSGVKEAAVGYFHGMALQTNGDLWIWGGDYGISISRRQSTNGTC